MSNHKDVVFTIKGGVIEMDLENFHGVGCKEVADGFKSLGATTKEVIKQDYYKPAETHVKLTQNA